MIESVIDVLLIKPQTKALRKFAGEGGLRVNQEAKSVYHKKERFASFVAQDKGRAPTA